MEILPRVFAHPARARSFETRVEALRLWLPRSCVVSGLAALYLFELCESEPAVVTVITPRNLHLTGPSWLRVVRCGMVTTRQVSGGVMCASKERALIDAWIEARDVDKISTVLEAMRRSSIKGSAVLRELAKMPRVRRRRELVAILHAASEGIQSYLEHRARRTVLNTADFRDLGRQVTIPAMSTEYVVDTLDEPTRTIIEFDGAKVHGTHAAKKRDNARDAALATMGYLTIRIGYDDVMTRPRWCREVIRAAIAVRAGGNVRVASAA
ncbi:DUF559 domain-containing protein [Demequina sp.]|uniref:DUF559 domain-containing protein n=1 Tax=Demequina sp. TaxID=2050685 RepID=UPI003D0E9B9C